MLNWLFNPYNFPFWIIISSIIIAIAGIAYRPFSTYMMFVYPNAKFEATGNPFITNKELNNLVDSKNLDSFKETLNNLKDYEITGESAHDIQESLDKNFLHNIQMMKKDSSKKLDEFYNTYIQKIDLILIKNQLKKKIMEKNITNNVAEKAILPQNKKCLEEIAEIEKEEIPNLLKKYEFEKPVIDAFSKEEFNNIEVDTTIDKQIFNQFLQLHLPYKCENAKKKFVKTLMDIRNIKNLLRAKQLGYDQETCKKLFVGEGQEIAAWKHQELSEVDEVPQVISGLEGTSYYDPLKDTIEEYNQEQSVQVLENALDRTLLKHVKELSMENYLNIGPTIRFLVSKEFEIQNLKIISKGIQEKMPSEEIKKIFITEVE